MQPIKTILQQVITQAKATSELDLPLNGIATGYTELDKVLGGFRKSTLNIIASRPSMGKSAFVDTMIVNMAVKNNASILYFSVESSTEILMLRFISNIGGLSLQRIKSSKLWTDEWKYIESVTNDLLNADILIDSTPNIDIDELCKKARKRHEEINLDVIVIDFLQLVTTTNTRAINNREQEISYIIRVLKGLSKELDVPIIVTSQLNRHSGITKYKAPELEDLRDSGTIEDVADTVIFIHRAEFFGITQTEESETTSGLAEIILAKNRHGDRERVKLGFSKDYCKFFDYEETSLPNSRYSDTEFGNGFNDFGFGSQVTVMSTPNGFDDAPF